MTLLTPIGALAALAVAAPLVAMLASRKRTELVRRRLGLPKPDAGAGIRPLLAAAAVVLLGLAAAQPVLTRTTTERSRTDVQALFVLDISRSMAAARSAKAPTRLDRAATAAVTLRNAIADVPSGVLTLTDRVLPNLLPVPDRDGFAAVVDRAVRIESPPPHGTAVRATSFSALAQIGSGNDFARQATKRVIVLLTDGESDTAATSDVARALSGYRFEAIRFWSPTEAVYDADGRAEAAYRPDPSGRLVLADLSSALGGRTFEEAQLRGASRYLRSLVGSGPTVEGHGGGRSRLPLAPYVALLGLLALLAAFAPSRLRLTKQ